MNKKVLFVSICLCVGILTSVYIAKFIFTDWVIGVATTPQIVKFGDFVDTYWYSKAIATAILSFTIWWLYLGACCRTWALNWKQIIAVILIIASSQAINYFATEYSLIYDMISLIVIPAAFGAHFKDTAVIFSIHTVNQVLSVGIRGIGIQAASANFATLLIIMIDLYIWLVLLYTYYNYKKKGGNDGNIGCANIRQQKELNNHSQGDCQSS